jgi:methylamine dehydrogenase light chain
MTNPLDGLLAWFDRKVENGARHTAQRIGRRNVLSMIGQAAVGGAILPMLPFDRSGHSAHAASTDGDDTACDYWRYCAIDGFLCSCCGGTVNSCPPGTEASKVAWVGTCQNPKDGKAYLISYNDCCGKVSCARCTCNNNVRERPGYRMGVHNDVNWCMADKSYAYNCTVAAVVGISENG